MFFFSERGVSVPRARGGGCSHECHMLAPSSPPPGQFLFVATNIPAVLDFAAPMPPLFVSLFLPFPAVCGNHGTPICSPRCFQGVGSALPGGFGTGRGAQIPWIGVPSVSCVPQFLWWCEDPIDLLVFHPVAVLYSHPLPALGALTAPLPVFPVYPRPFGPVGINEETPEPAQITGPEPGRRPGGGPPTMGGSPKTRQGQTLWILRQRRSCI